ncbi:uncharacterized protein LOC144456564 [Phascolarctos cinereus]
MTIDDKYRQIFTHWAFPFFEFDQKSDPAIGVAPAPAASPSGSAQEVGGEGKPAAARAATGVGRRSHPVCVSSVAFRPCAPDQPFPSLHRGGRDRLDNNKPNPGCGGDQGPALPPTREAASAAGLGGAPTALSFRRARSRRGAGGPGSAPQAVLSGLNPSPPGARRRREGSRGRSCRLAVPNGRFGAAAEALGGGGRWFRGPPGLPAEEEALPPGHQISF